MPDAGEREWWQVAGSLSASGTARRLMGYYSGYALPPSGSGPGTSSESYQETEATDHFDVTGSWLDRRDEDGTRTQSGTLTNDRSGTWTQQGYFESETPWGGQRQ